jgi:hypothetical protein
VGIRNVSAGGKAVRSRAFLDCLVDQRKLLSLYSQIAVEANGKGAALAVWSHEFLARLK